MAIAIYEDEDGRHHWAETTSQNTLQMLEEGKWLLFDDTPSTPPPTSDLLSSAIAERIPPAGTGAAAAALRAFVGTDAGVLAAQRAAFEPLVPPRYGAPFVQASGYPVQLELKADNDQLTWGGNEADDIYVFGDDAGNVQKWFAQPVEMGGTSGLVGNVEPAFGQVGVDTPLRPVLTLSSLTDHTRLRFVGASNRGGERLLCVLVNGQPVSALPPVTPFPAAPGAAAADLSGFILTFPDSRMRVVEIITTLALYDMRGDGGTLLTENRRTGPSVGLIIDSWGVGSPYSGGVGVSGYLHAGTPWSIMESCQGGTGFNNAGGDPGLTTFGSTARLDPILAHDPDVLVFFGSINDEDGDASTAVAAALTKAQAQSPDTKVILIGHQMADRPNHALRMQQLRAAAAPFTNVLGVVDPTTWWAPYPDTKITTWLDQAHTSPMGSEFIAACIAYEVRRLTRIAGDYRF